MAAGIKPIAGDAAYGTSKASIRFFTQVAALEGAAHKVRMVSVSPGAVATPMWESTEMWPKEAAQMGGQEAAVKELVEKQGLAKPEDIAAAVLFLASDEARQITGTDLAVDGGFGISQLGGRAVSLKRHTKHEDQMRDTEQEPGGFPWLVLGALCGVLVLGVFLWFGFPLTRMFVGIFQASRTIQAQQEQMQTPAVYQPVAHDLAILCQSGAALHPTGQVGIAWLPRSVRAFAPNFVTITESNAVAGIGGGFIDLYGYNLERGPVQSSHGSNSWQLFFTGRAAASAPLYTFSTSTSEVLSASDFIQATLAEYQREAALKQDEIYALRVQQHRLNFLLQLDPRRVREACVLATQDMPSHWWPRLTLAIVDASHGKNPGAEQELTHWADSNPSYSRYLCLAYFFQVMQRPEEAAAAVEKAVTFPIVDLPDDMTNTECRGYSAGVYLFGARKYSTVVRLCDVLLPVRENGDYAKAALRDLKAKALAAQAGQQVDFAPSDQVLGFNPYEEVSLDALRSAPAP